MQVAVILINWNSFLLSSDCINSLQKMKYRDYDIIVADNASQDGSGKKLKAHFPGIILIESPENLGFAGGNNLAMQYAVEHSYTYVFLLNNDTFVKEDVLATLVSYMDEYSNTGAVQPMICFAHDRSKLWNGGSYFNRWLGSTFVNNSPDPEISQQEGLKNVDWISGCAFFTRVAVLKQTGLFAENMFMYYEDVDLSFRIRKLGLACVYHPGSAIYHIAGMATKTEIKGKEGFISPLIHYYNTRNRIWVLKKYTAPMYIPTALLYNLAYITAILAYFTVRMRFTKFKAVIRGVKDGIAGHIRYPA